MAITPNNVENALRALLYSSGPPALSPLVDLVSVSHLISNPAAPVTPLRRRFALNQLLVDTLTNRLIHLRRVHGLSLPEADDSRQDAIRQIVNDAMTGNQELISASWLYHRYIRIDLNLSPNEFAAAVRIDPRTLRLYHRHGIARVTDALLQCEWQIRQNERRLRLLMALPVIRIPRLYGRASLLEHIRSTILQVRPQHIEINGEAGIGKTALAHELVRQLIDDDLLDDVIWLEHSRSVEIIRRALDKRCVSLPLRQYAARFNVAIVIDHASTLSPAAFCRLLRELSMALVIVINRESLGLEAIQGHISVPPLQEKDAKAYIHALAAAHYRGEEFALTEHEVDFIWSQVGGHPGRIRESALTF